MQRFDFSFLKTIDWESQWQSFWRGFRLVLIFGLFAIGVPGMKPNRNSSQFQALGPARDHLFDFAAWEGASVIDKVSMALVAPQQYMTDQQRGDYVLKYLQLVRNIEVSEQAVERIYVNPSITNPDGRSAGVQGLRDDLRAEQHRGQALAESIIEGQISEMLNEYGFGTAGQILPPVSIRFTELPTIMIVSPRDHIERTGAYALEHGLTVEQMDHIEHDVDHDLDVSSLIVPLGGLAMYPAMLIETPYVSSVFNVGSHEWTHHYLAFYPLGFHYGLSTDLYTMNETVANIVGGEIGWAVLNKYYPDYAGDPPDYTPQPPQQQEERSAAPIDPSVFDFNREMRVTRIHAEELLGAGKIDEAEQYMEGRRTVFVEQGYQIRKLNQAYFAFYGSYADQPGATGADPIGPALRDLRYYSGSLIDFVRRVRGLTSYDDLRKALDAARRDYEATHPAQK